MGKRGECFGAVKKVFSPESKENKGVKSKKWGFRKSKHSNPCFSEKSHNIAPDVASPPPQPQPTPLPEDIKDIKLTQVAKEQDILVYSVAIASAAAAEAAVAAAQAAAEVVRLTNSTKFTGKSREEVSAIKIQTAFRGYLARRAMRALRGLVRLKSLIHGNAVKRQATTTLRCMQTLARVQSQIRSRRIRMVEENQALQHQLLLKRERELESMRMGEEWDDSMQSKEQIEARLVSRQEAVMRRERALAYAFSHQWKNSSSSVNPMFMDPNNPQWGWSWLDRWMASRPWENRSSTADKDLLNSDRASVKSATEGEIIKAYAHRDGNLNGAMHNTPQRSMRLPTHQPPATPPSTVLTVTGKIKSASPRNGWHPADDDTKSMLSIQSERPRRHSIAGSSIRDDESLAATSPSIPSYMAPTESARAKIRFQSQLISDVKIETTPDKGSAGSGKKRLSFPPSPAAARRHSGPPRFDGTVAAKEVDVKSEQNGSNAERK